MNFNYAPKSLAGNEPEALNTHNRPGFIFRNSKNWQSFNYAYTDAGGIRTHINFDAGDAGEGNANRIAGREKTAPQKNDLYITPLFSSGKSAMSFSLPAAADITLKNTEGNVIFTDRTRSGSFSKSFDLLKYGVYYRVVKKGASLGLKRITKEE